MHLHSTNTNIRDLVVIDTSDSDVWLLAGTTSRDIVDNVRIGNIVVVIVLAI